MEKRLSLAQNTLYNTIGSGFYLVCQWLTTVLVIRLGSIESGGVLTLAMSVSGIFYILSGVGRPYQVSDYSHKYSTGEYVGIRYLTCIIALIGCFIYCLFNQLNSGYEFACIIAHMCFRSVDALSDEYQAIQQIAERMDITFRSFIIRGLLLLSAFGVTMAVTKDLFVALCITTVIPLIVILVYDIPKCKKLAGYHICFSIKRCLQFLWDNFPMMINSLLLVCCVYIPRTTLNEMWGNYIMGIYGSISAPAAIIQNVALWLFIPFMTGLTREYNEKKKSAFYSLHYKVLLLLFGAVMIVLLGAKFLGHWGLNLLFGEEIAAYDMLLIPTLMTAALVAMGYYVSTLLTVVRLFKPMVVSNIISFVVMLVFQRPLIAQYGAYGVNYIIYISLGINLLIQYISLVIYLNKWFSRKSLSEGDMVE